MNRGFRTPDDTQFCILSTVEAASFHRECIDSGTHETAPCPPVEDLAPHRSRKDCLLAGCSVRDNIAHI
jgi:hypothetical protein